MAKKLMGECSCGFSFVTPHGEDDAVKVLQCHIQLIHKKGFPKDLTKLEAMAVKRNELTKE